MFGHAKATPFPGSETGATLDPRFAIMLANVTACAL